MTFIIGQDGACPDGVEDAAHRVRILAEDLLRFIERSGPTAYELADAPMLDQWALENMALPCLTGMVTGHPEVRGPRIRTSQLWIIDPAARWARTESRLYRLGNALHSRASVIQSILN